MAHRGTPRRVPTQPNEDSSNSVTLIFRNCASALMGDGITHIINATKHSVSAVPP